MAVPPDDARAPSRFHYQARAAAGRDSMGTGTHVGRRLSSLKPVERRSRVRRICRAIKRQRSSSSSTERNSRRKSSPSGSTSRSAHRGQGRGRAGSASRSRSCLAGPARSFPGSRARAVAGRCPLGVSHPGSAKASASRPINCRRRGGFRSRGPTPLLPGSKTSASSRASRRRVARGATHFRSSGWRAPKSSASAELRGVTSLVPTSVRLPSRGRLPGKRDATGGARAMREAGPGKQNPGASPRPRGA